MGSLRKDTKGQWIALSGLVISLILIGLAVLANQAILAGYHSSNAALEFPKENIRELNLHTHDNARMIRSMSFYINSTTNETVPDAFDQLFDNYSIQMKKLYAVHGEVVDVSMVSINSTTGKYTMDDIDMVLVNITYDDGITHYVAEPELIEVNK
ncbi:hypothetical protein SAMN04488589_2620 [Methanolobus vulcani]|jgi:hypothetical protein|uniref:Uncharacterized protein n=1 Tax=Methanolobus vulcani TaxID=38026 RepID=A0A7Z7FDM2_9EURY|nr:hypothetical protein [Methanolobus vulcani]MDK2826365.1 hypothetical protein [Methanolobus sp.]MDK2948134.1 hypothetical protein [Methanolobus sp.]SDG29477.1 hypothetical protein SAMN04488589_2620 [Methanolobus vulcani]